jgi:hypothetical protein
LLEDWCQANVCSVASFRKGPFELLEQLTPGVLSDFFNAVHMHYEKSLYSRRHGEFKRVKTLLPTGIDLNMLLRMQEPHGKWGIDRLGVTIILKQIYDN